ncbi:hypothetical protein H7X87_00245 [Acetobacteraceae bacterium]|nr:hypothetical protein [Candidatus Parcubacteria bacterium]
MTQKNTLVAIASVLAVAVVGYFLFSGGYVSRSTPQDLDPTPYNVTLSGTYVCLPHMDMSGPQTEECAFGLQTEDGIYYAVNFGASGNAMEQFQSGTHITAEGFVVIKEALSSDQWAKYNMKGIFTITRMIDPAPVQGKLNIQVVCESALAYMTFPDGASAEKFVTECKAGEHPEVIERYKADMGYGEGAAI